MDVIFRSLGEFMYPSQMPSRSMIKCSPVAVSSGVQYPVSAKTKAKALVRLGLLSPGSWLLNTHQGALVRLLIGCFGVAWEVGLAVTGAASTLLNSIPVIIGVTSALSVFTQGVTEAYGYVSSSVRKKLDEEIARVQAEERGEAYVGDDEFEDLGYWGK